MEIGCYLDYAATAPLLPEVREAMGRALDEAGGNPSSLHGPGRRTRRLLEEARERCARALEAGVEEIVFTSGATEANNLALHGVMEGASPGAHLLVSAVEHPSVRECARALARRGFRVEELPVDDQGRVEPGTVARALRPETALVSVMLVNNEVGVRQPVEAIATLCQERGVLVHVDAVQAAGTERLRPAAWGADLLSISGHKLGGPPGCGLLWVRRGRRLVPLLRGGAQEDRRRAGTENVLGVVGLAAALERAAARAPREANRLSALRDRLEARLSRIPEAFCPGSGAPRAPHISAWVFPGVEAEPLLVALDLESIAASSGSACSSRSLEPSRVLQAMGLGEDAARGLVRLSLGWASTAADVDRVLEVLPGLVERLRQPATAGRRGSL